MNPVDLILASEVFEHLTDPIRELSSLFSLLGPSSIIQATRIWSHVHSYNMPELNRYKRTTYNWCFNRFVPVYLNAFFTFSQNANMLPV